MSDSTVWMVRRPQVMGEVIDGEAVIINLDTGTYYSARGSGAVVWSTIDGGATADQIVDALAEAYGADVPTGDISAFTAELEAEGLIEAAEAGRTPSGEPSAPVIPTGPYAPPALERFTDMEDLLLLDPVHDVDQLGWPHTPAP